MPKTKTQIENEIAPAKLGDLEARLVIVERHIIGCEALLTEMREERDALVESIEKKAKDFRMAFTGRTK